MSTLEKLILRRGGVLELVHRGSGQPFYSEEPDIEAVFEVEGVSRDGLAEILCKVARRGALADHLATVCDEEDLPLDLSNRVMGCVGIRLEFNLAGDGLLTALPSGLEITGAVPGGVGRTRLEAVRALAIHRAQDFKTPC